MMNDLSVRTYAPCYNVDPKTGKGSFGTYDFTRLLEQQAKLAAEERTPSVGKGTLTEEELQELAKRYDPTSMSKEDYSAFIGYLTEKGVLGRSETYDIGLDRVVLRPGNLLSRGVEQGRSPAARSAEGDALRWAELELGRSTGQADQVKAGAVKKVYDILREMEQRRRGPVV